MKKVLFVSLLSFLCVITLYSEVKTSKVPVFDFRKTRWGFTKEQVKLMETDKIIKESDSLIMYKSYVDNNDEKIEFACNIVYIFSKNKLIKAGYKYVLSDVFHSEWNDYVSTYNTYKGYLSEKYGKPFWSGKLWENDIYKTDNENLTGYLINEGFLRLMSVWKNKRTETSITLNSVKDKEMYFLIIYEDRLYLNYIEELKNTDSMKNEN